jgi:hypothetical protein
VGDPNGPSTSPDSDADVATDSDETVEEDDGDTEIWDTGGDATNEPDEPDEPADPIDPPDPPDTDTGPPPPTSPNGLYTGTFRLRWFAPLNAGDQLCSGPAQVVVDTTANPSVTASFSCDWDGFLPGVAELVGGYSDMSGTMTGWVNQSNQGRATGDLEATDGSTSESAAWTATFTGNDAQFSYDETVILVGGIKGTFTLTR